MSIYKITDNGESPFHIVAHRYADETVRYACSELQKYILKATGAVVPYFSDICPMRSPEIRIGDNVRYEKTKCEDLPPEGFRIYANGEHINITGSTSRGVLYGIYRFLEIFLNFRCFTKDCETIDKKDVFEIDLDEISEAPAFEFRDAYFRFAYDGDFCAKNRLNSSLGDISRAKGGRVKWFNFHHSFRDLVPEEEHFDSHPEYFSEIDGQRVRNSQICLTNPSVYEIARTKLRKWIVQNPECTVFSVAQNDNRRRCLCKNCLAVEAEEESPQGPIIRFVNALAKDIEADYPSVLIHTFAYQYSLPAPKITHARDNVIVRLCSISCRFDKPFEEYAKLCPDGEEAIFVNALKDWKNRAKRLYVWDYAVNFKNYLQPFLHFRVMTENVRFFRSLGILGVLEQGNFAYGGGASMDDLKSYLIGRLLWDPDTDTELEINKFLSAVYGESSAVYLKEYVETMEKACQGAQLSIYQLPNADYLNDDLIKKCDKLFKDAIEHAENCVFKERITREYLAIRFLILTRMELDAKDREEMINAFFKDVKSFGITEIMERTSLPASLDSMTRSRYAKDRSARYSLYYVMQ